MRVLRATIGVTTARWTEPYKRRPSHSGPWAGLPMQKSRKGKLLKIVDVALITHTVTHAHTAAAGRFVSIAHRLEKYLV